MPLKFLLPLSLVLPLSAPVHAGFMDWFRDLGASPETAAAGGLSQADIAAGLKQALEVGAGRAVGALSAENGFYGVPALRIPLPAQLQSLADTLRKFGQGALVDELELSMNRAAESAVGEALPVLSGAITSMNVNDAVAILNGPEDAATAYFRERTSDQLQSRFQPLVQQAMAENQVAQYYRSLSGAVKSIDKYGLMGLAVPDADQLDNYITQQTLSGAFTRLAEEEAKIRANPGARSTELLKKVFGGS